MRLRGRLKLALFGSIPLIRGRFRYYQHSIYFPLGSLLFKRACEEGIYERETTNLILGLVEPGSTYFDVGTNIGLLSVPVLAEHPDVKVVSVEASPSTLPFLQRTHASADRADDWTIVASAVGSEPGEAEFWSGGGADGALDGLRDTGRGKPKHKLRVPVTTLDQIWHDCGQPRVSVIKIDIEGGELSALRGANQLISSSQPTLIIEWTAKNLRAYGIESGAILELCESIGYSVYRFPNVALVDHEAALRLAMVETETFILAPRQQQTPGQPAAA